MNSRGIDDMLYMRRNAQAIAMTGPARATKMPFPFRHGPLSYHETEAETALREKALIAAEEMWKRQGG